MLALEELLCQSTQVADLLVKFLLLVTATQAAGSLVRGTSVNFEDSKPEQQVVSAAPFRLPNL